MRAKKEVVYVRNGAHQCV